MSTHQHALERSPNADEYACGSCGAKWTGSELNAVLRANAAELKLARIREAWKAFDEGGAIGYDRTSEDVKLEEALRAAIEEP